MNKDKAKAAKPLAKAPMPRSGTEAPNPVDIHVGGRIRMRRSMLGMSQETLADSVGLTFQQVQKYERGTNRVSASRLYQFSKILDVPVSYFFERYGEGDRQSGILSYGLEDNGQEPILNDNLLLERETHELLRFYYSVSDPKKRREILNIVKSMTQNLID